MMQDDTRKEEKVVFYTTRRTGEDMWNRWPEESRDVLTMLMNVSLSSLLRDCLGDLHCRGLGRSKGGS